MLQTRNTKSRNQTCNHYIQSFKTVFYLLTCYGKISTKLQRSLLPQSQTITSTVAVNWKVSISSCVSLEIIPNCLLFQAMLRTLSTVSLSSTELCLQSSSPPYLCSIAYLPSALMVSYRRGRSSQHMQETEGKGKKNIHKPKSRCYAF